MALFGIEKSKCFKTIEDVVRYRELHTFDDIGANSSSTYTINGSYGSAPVVAVTPWLPSNGDISDIECYTYIIPGTDTDELNVVVKNNGSTAITTIDVDIVII